MTQCHFHEQGGYVGLPQEAFPRLMVRTPICRFAAIAGVAPYKVCGFPPTTRRKSYVFVGAGAHDSPYSTTPFSQTPRLQSLRLAFARHLPLHKGGLWKVPANNTAIRNKLWMRREQAPALRWKTHKPVGALHEAPAWHNAFFANNAATVINRGWRRHQGTALRV